MPFIDVKTTVSITDAVKAEFSKKLGELITIIPGKSERWLMINIADACSMTFAGTSTPDIAMLEVKLFGKADPATYDKLTAALTAAVNDILGVSSDRVYVKYEECLNWGFNGSNF